MRCVDANGVTLHVRVDGDPTGVPVVFANSLGTDLRLWDDVIPLLPKGLRIIRYDKRGHGLSNCPSGPYSIDELAAEAIAVIEALECDRVIFVGLSIGGMIGQTIAAKRPDLLRALVISNSAAKMGDPLAWADRISLIKSGGLPAMQSAILDRWFGPTFRNTPEATMWGAMLSRTPQDGYIACCEAIAAADLTGATRMLHLPTLVIAGSHDGASPAELVSATADLIEGAEFHVIDDAGHLPCVENPAAFAAILTAFLKEHSDA